MAVFRVVRGSMCGNNRSACHGHSGGHGALKPRGTDFIHALPPTPHPDSLYPGQSDSSHDPANASLDLNAASTGATAGVVESCETRSSGGAEEGEREGEGDEKQQGHAEMGKGAAGHEAGDGVRGDGEEEAEKMKEEEEEEEGKEGEEEDWGLYIRGEEDYQRTKTRWTEAHKEWIEDQASGAWFDCSREKLLVLVHRNGGYDSHDMVCATGQGKRPRGSSCPER